MSTPTKEKPKHHLCDGKLYASKKFCPVHGEKETIQDVMEGGRKPWWYWFRIDVPKRPGQRADFIALLLAILVTEWIVGPIIGIILRSIFGWPF